MTRLGTSFLTREFRMHNERVIVINRAGTHSIVPSVARWAVNFIFISSEFNQNHKSFISLRIMYPPSSGITGQKSPQQINYSGQKTVSRGVV